VSSDSKFDGHTSAEERAAETSTGAAAEASAARGPFERSGGVTVDQLYAELQSDSGGTGVRLAPEQRAEVLLDDVQTALFDDSAPRVSESSVKENLDELLLVLVAHRESDTNGKSLMGDLATIFGAHLSPGTVYPQLHDLEAGDLLEVQELVRTKEYRVDDEAAVADRVRAAMEEHLLLGLFFQAALAELS
jgi:hypothetical protein